MMAPNIRVFRLLFSIAIVIFLTEVKATESEQWQKLSQNELDQLKEFLIEESDLLDPFSVQFRKVNSNPNARVVCGQLNAKNRNGAYTGWSRFTVATDNAKFSHIEIERKDSPSEAVELACSGSPGFPAYIKLAGPDCSKRDGKKWEAVRSDGFWKPKKVKIWYFLSPCASDDVKVLNGYCESLKEDGRKWEPAAPKEMARGGLDESPGVDYASVRISDGKEQAWVYLASQRRVRLEYPLQRKYSVLCVSREQ